MIMKDEFTLAQIENCEERLKLLRADENHPDFINPLSPYLIYTVQGEQRMYYQERHERRGFHVGMRDDRAGAMYFSAEAYELSRKIIPSEYPIEKIHIMDFIKQRIIEVETEKTALETC